jgi:hypothetical protein
MQRQISRCQEEMKEDMTDMTDMVQEVRLMQHSNPSQIAEEVGCASRMILEYSLMITLYRNIFERHVLLEL